MADKPEPKQTTRKGIEIPVPKREDVLRDFAKVAGKPAPPQNGSPAGTEGSR
jgi:hypothetical protein